LEVFGFFFPVSSITVFIGLVHFSGLVAAAVLCFVIGVGLCAHGLVPAPEPEKKTVSQPRDFFAFLRRRTASVLTHEEPEAALRCVRCRVALATPAHICPDCGWTQPQVPGPDLRQTFSPVPACELKKTKNKFRYFSLLSPR